MIFHYVTEGDALLFNCITDLHQSQNLNVSNFNAYLLFPKFIVLLSVLVRLCLVLQLIYLASLFRLSFHQNARTGCSVLGLTFQSWEHFLFLRSSLFRFVVFHVVRIRDLQQPLCGESHQIELVIGMDVIPLVAMMDPWDWYPILYVKSNLVHHQRGSN